MNLDTFLAEAEEAGRTDSRGVFTTTMAGMLKRMADSLLVDPTHAPLVVVASAVAAGARGLEIAVRRKELVFGFLMEEPPVDEATWQALRGGPARHLVAAAAVWRKQASKVSLMLPGQGRELVLTATSIALESHRREGGVQLVVVGKVPARQSLELLLLRHCGLCPIPVSLDGRPLQASLNQVYGRTGFWSSSLPEHLRPSGEAKLQSALAVALNPTSLVKPNWVAVVGGISYPFLLPEAGGVQGIVWSERLRTDLSFTGVAWDSVWSEVREELLRQVRRAGLLPELGCPLCAPATESPPGGLCRALSERLGERVLLPTMVGYSLEVAGFNTAYTHKSLMAVAARDVADVVETVRYARRHRQRIAIQSTGHGVHQPIEQEILLSMRRFDRLEIDAESRIATVGAGVTWGSLFEAARPYELLAVAGSSRDVGVIGYLLGGGLGPLARSHGFSSDYLEELTVVNGEGRVLRASAGENPDLFWALRGGKRGLGVVLEARLRLVAIPELYGGSLSFGGGETFDLTPILAGWLRWTQTAPQEVSTSFAFAKRGHYRSVELRFVYPGPGSRGQELAAPLVALGSSALRLGDRSREWDFLPYLHRDPSEPSPFWVSGMSFNHLDESFATTMSRGLKERQTLQGFEFRHLGGAAARDVAEGSAVGGRTAGFVGGFVWSPEVGLFDQAHPCSERRLREELAPWAASQTNINFAARIRDREHFDSAWPKEIRQKLARIRGDHDPDGVFRENSWSGS